jgi:hypothetical protein
VVVVQRKLYAVKQVVVIQRWSLTQDRQQFHTLSMLIHQSKPKYSLFAVFPPLMLNFLKLQTGTKHWTPTSLRTRAGLRTTMPAEDMRAFKELTRSQLKHFTKPQYGLSNLQDVI